MQYEIRDTQNEKRKTKKEIRNTKYVIRNIFPSRFTYRVSRITGFTLIELLVAMTIVAILMGISLVSYQGARKSARDGKRKTDLEQIRSALEMCRTDSGSYPVGTLSSGSSITCGAKTYLTIPTDPLTDRIYSYTGTANTYTLCAVLEVSGGTVTNCGSCTLTCNYKVLNP